MKTQIINWLNSERDFHKGAALYNQYGDNRNMKISFCITAPSKRLWEMLIFELCKLIQLTPTEFYEVKNGKKLPMPGVDPGIM